MGAAMIMFTPGATGTSSHCHHPDLSGKGLDLLHTLGIATRSLFDVEDSGMTGNSHIAAEDGDEENADQGRVVVSEWLMCCSAYSSAVNCNHPLEPWRDKRESSSVYSAPMSVLMMVRICSVYMHL